MNIELSNVVLTDIKLMLGIDECDTDFDLQLLSHINSVMAILRSEGLIPIPVICNDVTSWLGIGATYETVAALRQITYNRVRTLFDPPANSTVMQALKDNSAELEWRMMAENPY